MTLSPAPVDLILSWSFCLLEVTLVGCKSRVTFSLLGCLGIDSMPSTQKCLLPLSFMSAYKTKQALHLPVTYFRRKVEKLMNSGEFA